MPSSYIEWSLSQGQQSLNNLTLEQHQWNHLVPPDWLAQHDYQKLAAAAFIKALREQDKEPAPAAKIETLEELAERVLRDVAGVSEGLVQRLHDACAQRLARIEHDKAVGRALRINFAKLY